MSTQRYSVAPHPIETLLSFVKCRDIAIPEIQRPFVWDATKVRNLLDSLYQGYPIGYLITWRNPTVKLKDGTSAAGKQILIDGQQRVTALMAALLGREVLTKDYETVRIRIAFHPQEERFEVANFAMSKIAVNESYDGNLLRKAIDYFCHLAVAPEFLGRIEKSDKAFAQSEFLPKMRWLRDVNDDLYDPTYTDMLRVAFTSEFGRGKLQDLVALLSGRNFETKQFEESIAEESFSRLKKGILAFINKNHFDKDCRADATTRSAISCSPRARSTSPLATNHRNSISASSPNSAMAGRGATAASRTPPSCGRISERTVSRSDCWTAGYRPTTTCWRSAAA